MDSIIEQIYIVGQGIVMTLQLLIGGLTIGIILGTLISIIRYKKTAIFLINPIISIIRGTPLILQLTFVYFSIPGITGIKFSILGAGILTFGLNSFAYISEILRAGIENIPSGQFEAAQTLQITPFYTWKDIILPQVGKQVLRPMIGEAIALLKETALIATIGGMDIMRSAQTVAAEKFTYFTPLCIAGLYYYAIVICIEYYGKKLQTKWNYA